MTEKITLEQVLELVSFQKSSNGPWEVLTVYGDVHGEVFGDVHYGVHGGVRGDVHGGVCGSIGGSVHGTVFGSVGNILGDVHDNVKGIINGRRWQSVETSQEKLERLIQESGDQELIEAFNQHQQEVK